MSIPAADALMQVFGFERVTKMVYELKHGDRFTVDGSDIVWTFRSMDGAYCFAKSSTGQILSWSGPVTIVK
jgi:hypothetical protein